ncbi:(2Fe-2S)-binding protein [Alphaproteobacteria bacterium 46_93_T64]|nr:(2Fe-2S)-binding protein [Alphaproteobacteria bacterium 46_93_T64]
MTYLLNDNDVIKRIFSHIDEKTTDLGDAVWHEPTDNYKSQERFDAELQLLRQLPVPFCPSAALPENGSYVARTAAGRPILSVRGEDGVVRAFFNNCRHRGMAVAKDSGCARAFVCPYHAWTYGLDGQLKHIPGADGFPDVDPEKHGLVQITAEERGGIVFVTQEDPVSEGALEAMPDLIGPDQVVFDQSEFTDEANWKLIGETSMEGYHIKSLHNKSFYPYGLDNINVVETYGPNSRITFPFRRINKLRDIPEEKRRIDGMVTYVYQLFPNTHFTVLSSHSLLIILEPISPSQTKWIIYRLKNRGEDGAEISTEEAKRDAEFVKDTGLDEDREAACTIHAGLDSNANEHFTFGHFEKAIVHFHSGLKKLL